MWTFGLELHALLLLGLLVGPLTARPRSDAEHGVRTIEFLTAQIWPRGDSSNTTQNTLDFFVSLNNTLIKHDASPLESLPNLLEADPNDAASTDKPYIGYGTVEVTKREVKQRRTQSAPVKTSSVETLDRNWDLFNAFGTCTIGSSMMEIPVLFDTGSKDLVVPGMQCSAADGCEGQIKYDETGVATGVETTVSYSWEKAFPGRYFMDKVTVAGMEARTVKILSLREGRILPVVDGNSAGIMGLAPNWGSFFNALVEEGSVSRHEFSFYFNPDNAGTSEFTIGSSNPQRYEGAPVTQETKREGRWDVQYDSIRYGQNFEQIEPRSGPTGNIMNVDTGNPYMFLPKSSVRAVMSYHQSCYELPMHNKGVKVPTSGYLCSCSTSIKVAIRMQARTLEVDPAYLMGPEISKGLLASTGYTFPEWLLAAERVCYAFLVGYDTPEGSGVLGMPFLKTWYSIFNLDNVNGKPSVTFARSEG